MLGNNKNLFLSPFFATIFIVAAMVVYYVVCYIFRANFGVFDIEEIGATEIITYLFYGFAGGVLLCCAGDFLNSPRSKTYFALVFLWFVALLREMGIQHWLTTHDTVVTKSRFFLNPDNPLHEKIIAGLLMLIVLAVCLWLFIKYFKRLVCGLLKLQALCWTVVTTGVFGVLTQIIDRFPANYAKNVGTALMEPTLFALKIFEEGGESLLPLLFALALIQSHFSLKDKQ